MATSPLTPRPSAVDAAAEKVIAGISDASVEVRYPDGCHFVPADHPRHGEMLTRALFAGEPAVLVFPDGREMLFTPEHARGIAGLMLFLAAAWISIRSRGRTTSSAIQLPPRTRIEARDSHGVPVAA